MNNDNYKILFLLLLFFLT